MPPMFKGKGREPRKLGMERIVREKGKTSKNSIKNQSQIPKESVLTKAS